MISTAMKKFYQSMTRLYLRFSGFSYTNMARLFMRLFVGVMFMQFGIRHLVHYNELSTTFPAVFGMSPVTTLTLMICIELICSLLIMVGFLTRIATLPAILSMIASEAYLLQTANSFPTTVWAIDSPLPGYLPIMFIGIFLFILLAGPGKISVDYFISLFIISRQKLDEKEELEEV